MISTVSCCCCPCCGDGVVDSADEQEQTRSLVPKITKEDHSEELKEQSSFKRQPWRRERLRKRVAVEKKYHLKSPKLDSRDSSKTYLTTDKILLKITIKKSKETNKIKISATEANNVITVMRTKSCSLPKSPSKAEKLPIVQLHTKLLSTETRKYSKLYKVSETITGAIRFTNEYVHSMSVTDFLNEVEIPKLRFRLYYIMKPRNPLGHKSNVLLGEYSLDLRKSNLRVQISNFEIINVLMQLHDIDAEDVNPPEIFALHSRKNVSPFEKLHHQAQMHTEKLEDLEETTEIMNDESNTLSQKCVSIRMKEETKAGKKIMK